MPRLCAFAERFPDVELELLASTRVVDLAREDVDLSIRHGRGDWEGVLASELCPGSLSPVCAPALLKRHGGAASLVANVRRIQTTSANEWRSWAQAAAVDIDAAPPLIAMEDFLVALRIAITGQGLLMLPEILVRDPVARGDLVRFSPVDGPSDMTFHVVRTPAAARRPLVEDISAWLVQQAACPA